MATIHDCELTTRALFPYAPIGLAVRNYSAILVKIAYSPRHRSPLWATLTLLTVVSGLLLAPIAGRQDAARRVRAAGTRGIQVRVEPYGRAAVEHAYLDDDEDDAAAGTLIAGLDHERSRAQAPSKAFLSTAAALPRPAAASRVLLPPSHLAVRSSDQLGVPAGRAPPRA